MPFIHHHSTVHFSVIERNTPEIVICFDGKKYLPLAIYSDKYHIINGLNFKSDMSRKKTKKSQ